MYLVQAVSSPSRPWSSYTNISGKDARTIMNSTEEIARYSDCKSHYYSPTLVRRTAVSSYDIPEKSPKKDKKWSIGSLFRRKKKDESESSSDEDVQKKNFLGRRKRKPEKRKKPAKAVGTFDHVVIPHALRSPNTLSNGHGVHDENNGIFSDPSTGFYGFTGRPLPKVPADSNENTNKLKNSKESLNYSDIPNSRLSLGSVDSLSKRNRRELTLARAEKRRDKFDSSSDEDSQRSVSSSARFRSDENLGRQRDGSMNRRSRAARTERYIRRLSRDDENPYKDQTRAYKSDMENNSHVNRWIVNDSYSSRSPNLNTKTKLNYSNSEPLQSTFSGLSTIPPGHGSFGKYKVSNSTSNPSYKPPLSLNDYYNNSMRKKEDIKIKNSGDVYFNQSMNNQRSISCDNNIHKSENESEILHVQLPLGKASMMIPRSSNSLEMTYSKNKNAQRQPPPPPPRDPKRLITVQYFDCGRPISYSFEKACQQRKTLQPFKSSSFNENSTAKTVESGKTIYPRSTSEDHLPLEHFPGMMLAPRPSSVTPEVTKSQRFIKRHPEVADNYQYLTDKNPRSRKPIVVQNIYNQQNNTQQNSIKKPLEFWKQKDKEHSLSQEKLNFRKSGSCSPQMFTSQTHVRTKVFLPSVLNTDINLSNTPIMDRVRESSPFKPISPTLTESKISLASDTSKTGNTGKVENNQENIKRKSSNLEDALDELEAIYNSLKLGDEDLLERAEQREMSVAAEKLINNKSDIYPSWGISRGAISDSNFSYEPFDTVDSPRRKRLLKRSRNCDRKTDDMAYRKLNKERSNTINDPQAVVAKVSYLLASPVFSNSNEDVSVASTNNKEPDVTLDDVVYRSIKHANNSLKVVEPQPPFGIPLGPVTPAANSDYLHAVPEPVPVLTKPGKIPDIVKDDLAFRNLRKDSNKEPALPPLATEDFLNNNNVYHNCLKKKRATRSLSANIFNLMHSENFRLQKKPEVVPVQSLTDIADAMEIARQVLRDKENKITATRRAFMSDSEAKCMKNDKKYVCANVDNFTENRLNFLNEMKTGGALINNKNNLQQKLQISIPLPNDDILHKKPPTGSSDTKLSRSPTKESTPIPLSPLEEKMLQKNNSTKSSFDDLLTALAVEARETSERITNELRLLNEDKLKKSEDHDQEKHRTDLNKKLYEIDAVSEHAKLCEKLLECVVDSTDLIVSSKLESAPVEEVEQMKIDSALEKSFANEVEVCVDDADDHKINSFHMEVFSESEHDYENMGSDVEAPSEIPFIEDEVDSDVICKSPFEEHKDELIASFQELSHVDEKNLNASKEEIEEVTSDTSKTCKEDSASADDDGKAEGEACVGVLEINNDLLNDDTKECAFVSKSLININEDGSLVSFVSNCDIIVNNHSRFCADDKKSSENYKSTFYMPTTSSEDKNSDDLININSLTAWKNSSSNLIESLKSPKLVLESTKLTNAFNKKLEDDTSNECCSKNIPVDSKVGKDRNVPETVKLNSGLSMSISSPRCLSRDSRHTLNESKPTRAWYCDPAIIIACTYGIACTHQLASMDFLAVLGLLFAIITFITALLL